MTLNLQDDDAANASGNASCPAPRKVVVEGALPSRLAPPSIDGRQRFVVGIFTIAADAARVAGQMSSVPCELLVIGDPSQFATLRKAATGGELICVHHLDPFVAPAPALSAVPDAFSRFLSSSVAGSAISSTRQPSDGTEPLLRKLIRHVSTGAAAVVVHAHGLEAQLRASRVLLDAKCAMLLTHDAVLPAVADGTHVVADGCCQQCTTKSCGRALPPAV